MWSPGRPSTARREDRVRFWTAIARGVSTDDAAAEACVSSAVGARWFRQGGGMPSISLAPATGRYLTLNERTSRSGVCSTSACARRPAGWAGRRQRSLASCAATRRLAATSWRIGRPRRSGTPSGVPAARRCPRTSARDSSTDERAIPGSDQVSASTQRSPCRLRRFRVEGVCARAVQEIERTRRSSRRSSA